MSSEKVGKYFRREEFSCGCGCGYDDINTNLVSELDLIRELLRQPITINSGCRCPRHNASVGGKPDSAHTTGNAVDISVANSSYRYQLLKIIFKYFNLNRIGIDKGFVHVDNDQNKPPEVSWVY